MLPSPLLLYDGGRLLRVAFASIVFSGIALYIILHGDAPAPHNDGFTAPSYFSTNTDDTRNISHHDYEIVTTDYGWRNPAKNPSQRKLSSEFFAAVVAHPRFNASATWEELHRRPDPARRLVVFLDVDTCIENNYPFYGKPWQENMHVRVEGEKWYSVLDKACRHIKRAAESPALTANRGSRLVLLDCGHGPSYNLKDVCGSDGYASQRGVGWGDVLNNKQVIIAYYGISKSQARPIDIGLPPPAVKPIDLTPYERYAIGIKNAERGLLFSFQGQGGFGREGLTHLDNGKDVYVRIRERATYWGRPGEDIYEYGETMRNSVFAGAPPGDCLWSYRFAEILSAGAVPVVHAADWLPPFASPADPARVVDWKQCAVFHDLGGVNDTVRALRAITRGVRDEMQRCALAFWDEFGSSREGWLRGILLWINNEPGITEV